MPLRMRRVDDAAARAAELGAVVRGLDAELLHGIGRELHDLIRKALIAGAVRVVVDAIDDEIVQRTAHAVHVERSVAAARDAGFAYARRKQRQVGVRAAVQWQIDDLIGADDGAAGTGVGLKRCRGIGDHDLLGHIADLQREIYSLARVDGDSELAGDGFFEALRFAGQTVGTDGNVENLEIAGVIRVGVLLDAGFDVFERDLCGGYSGSAGVADRAQH